MSVRETLQAAYAAASYRIDCGARTIERRIGRVDAAADAQLEEAGCRAHWHVVTPCNPRSQRLSDEDNAERLRSMRAEIEQRGCAYLSAENGDAGSDWLEPGFCLLDVPRAEALALARRYGQLAIVEGRLGEAPELIG